MPRISITRADMLRSTTLKPGWYKVSVKRVGEKPAKTDGSTTYPVDMIVISPAEFAEVPLQQVFSEKAPGFAVAFIEAFKPGAVTKDGGNFELADAEGRECEVFIENEMYEGRLTNKVKSYRPVQS